MKLLVILISFLVTFGCAHNQMQYAIPPGSTQDDFNKARIECGDSKSGGYFLFGPLIILAPAVAVIESVKFAKRHGLQDCLEGKGFRCIENCVHVSQYQEPGKQELSGGKRELERRNALDAGRDQLAAPAPNPAPALVPVSPEQKRDVEGGTGRDGRFIAYNNGTVLDTRTGLMWAEKDNGSGIGWQGAKSYCENYRGGGYTDWRMPTYSELEMLHDTRIDGINGYSLTRVIELTKCCPWASDVSGAYFRFDGGTREKNTGLWFFNAFSYRALPVRSAK